MKETFDKIYSFTKGKKIKSYTIMPYVTFPSQNGMRVKLDDMIIDLPMNNMIYNKIMKGQFWVEYQQYIRTKKLERIVNG